MTVPHLLNMSDFENLGFCNHLLLSIPTSPYLYGMLNTRLQNGSGLLTVADDRPSAHDHTRSQTRLR
jgi:hypothetical protein